MKRITLIAVAVILPLLARAQEFEIVSFHQNGLVTWTNAPEYSNRTYRVEWSDDLLSNAWCASWAALTNIPHSTGGMSAAVPMFYRVVMNPLTIHVSTNGNDDTGMGTTNSPFATIQKGIDVAVDGDTVLVEPGTYTGSGNRDLQIAKNITLKSAGGPASTIIDCGDATRAAGISGTNPRRLMNVVMDGFTIQNAHAHALGDWGSIYPGNIINVLYAAPTIRNCVIRSCRVTSGYSTTHASIMDVQPPSQTGTVENCVAVQNSLQAGSNGGAAAYLFGCVRVFNATIASNTLSQGGRRMVTTGPAGFYNSIVWGNAGLTSFSDSSGGSVVVQYSDVEGGIAGEGNLNSSPQFDSDYSLQAGSPCLDKGTNSFVTATKDVLGNPRIVNGIVDMGALERQ